MARLTRRDVHVASRRSFERTCGIRQLLPLKGWSLKPRTRPHLSSRNRVRTNVALFVRTFIPPTSRPITACKAKLTEDIRRLTDQTASLNAALRHCHDTIAEERSVRAGLEHDLAVSERTLEAQQHELDWLWREWERHQTGRGRPSAPPVVVHLHPRRSSWSVAAPPTYGRST